MNKLLYVKLFLFACTICTSIYGQEVPSENSQITEQSLIATAIRQLQLKLLKEPSDLDIALHKVLPNNLEETIVVIPETVNEADDYYELNTHIFIVDNKTGQITNSYFESSKTNGWTSDAIFIDDIVIDTTAYKLTPSKNAFGIIVRWRSGSRPNPYRQERISLYTKERDSLKKVLDMYPIFEATGEANINACYAKFNKTARELYESTCVTNGYYDILVDENISEEIYQEDENGECNPKEKVISTQKTVLEFSNGTYKKKY